MSLVIALSASRKAAIGSDRRAISFLGACQELEEELYSGRIQDDRELEAKAKEHKAIIHITDGREKVWKRGDILVGEVTEITSRISRRRRIYLAPKASLQVDITSCEDADDGGFCGTARIRAWGGVGCVIFGNRFTQKLAADEIALAGGRVDEALIGAILTKAGRVTASVSREHMVLSSDVVHSDAKAAILRVLEEDCKESGWKLCDLQ